jgi:hypothetical protein
MTIWLNVSLPSFTFILSHKNTTFHLFCTYQVSNQRQDLYELLVVAEDGGSPKYSSIALVSIQIQDKNDSPPKFEVFGSPTTTTRRTGSGSTSTSSAAAATSRVVKVMEDWPVGGVVTQVIARDEDLGMAGRVRYSLLETGAGEEDFVIDEVSGVLRVKKQLDYETTSIYNLTVRAKDMGTPALSSDTFIVVEVS